jgi:hypothetical protein
MSCFLSSMTRRRLAGLALAVGLVVGFSGCESLSDAAAGVRTRLAPRDEPRVQTFEAIPRLTYEAVRAAAAQMEYRFVRGGPAQGEFDAVSRIGAGEREGSSRQLSLKARLRATLDGKGTEITLRITEIIEPDTSNRAGLATETPLRDSPQFEVFFRRVKDALATVAKDAK